MQSINLATEGEIKKDSGSIFGKSIIIAIAILIFVLILYAALLFLNRNLVSKFEVTNGQYKAEYNNFLEGNANKVIDYKNRSESAASLLDNNTSMGETFRKLEASLVPSIYLNSFEYDKLKKTITLSAVADNFNTVAKQILSFKESGHFSDVIPGKSAYENQGEDSVLVFNVILKLK